MILLDDFYYIVSGCERECRYKVRMNKSHGIYKAHFPDNPVTPGVCLVQMAEEILELHLGKKLFLQKAKDIKFKIPVFPKDEPEFVYLIDRREDNFLNVDCRVEKGDGLFAKMALLFKCSD